MKKWWGSSMVVVLMAIILSFTVSPVTQANSTEVDGSSDHPITLNLNLYTGFSCVDDQNSASGYVTCDVDLSTKMLSNFVFEDPCADHGLVELRMTGGKLVIEHLLVGNGHWGMRLFKFQDVQATDADGRIFDLEMGGHVYDDGMQISGSLWMTISKDQDSVWVRANWSSRNSAGNVTLLTCTMGA